LLATWSVACIVASGKIEQHRFTASASGLLAAKPSGRKLPLAEGLRSTVALFREQLALEQVRL